MIDRRRSGKVINMLMYQINENLQLIKELSEVILLVVECFDELEKRIAKLEGKN